MREGQWRLNAVNTDGTQRLWTLDAPAPSEYPEFYQRLRKAHVSEIVACLNCCGFFRYLADRSDPIGFTVETMNARCECQEAFKLETAVRRRLAFLGCRELRLAVYEHFERSLIPLLIDRDVFPALKRLVLGVSYTGRLLLVTDRAVFQVPWDWNHLPDGLVRYLLTSRLDECTFYCNIYLTEPTTPCHWLRAFVQVRLQPMKFKYLLNLMFVGDADTAFF